MEVADMMMMVPPLFTCPISLDLFKDPVTLSTGQTYDRIFIQKWLSEGNLTCPVTMQRLEDLSMVPNHTLRHLIDNWLGAQSDFQLSDDAGFSIATAKKILWSDTSALEDKVRVLERIHSLSLELPLENYGLIRMGLFEAVLEVVFGLGFEAGSSVAEKGISCALKLLPFSDLTTLNMLQEKDKFEGFLHLLENGSLVIKKGLCLIVEAIASSLETRDLGKKLGNSSKLVREIVHLVKDRAEIAEFGIKAITMLSTMQENCESLVSEGTVEGLFDCMSNVEKLQTGRGKLGPSAMAAVENLLAVESGKQAVLRHPTGIKTMVRMVFRVSDRNGGSESAVNALSVLCADSRAVRERAVSEGVLVKLLLLLQSQCNGRIKGKARMLMKMIRARWDEDMNHGL